MKRHLSARGASVAAFAALFCLLPSAWARPHLLVLPIVVYWVACLLRAADAGRSPSLWLAPIMVIWANMHGSFLLGIGMMGAIGAEAVWRSKDRPGSVRAGGCLAAQRLRRRCSPRSGFRDIHIRSTSRR